jgi:ribosomal protein S27AE
MPLMVDYRKDWERYETRRTVLLAFMIVEFLIPFGLLGGPVSNYLLGGRYVWFVGLLVWVLLAVSTILTLGRFPCPRCGKKLPVVSKKKQTSCAACGLTKL